MVKVDDDTLEIRTILSQLSVPSKPISFGKEYMFPEELDKLSSPELGNWLSKLAAWEGYSMRLLTRSEIELTILEENFDIMFSKATAQEYDKSIGSKSPTKDFILGRLLTTNAEASQIRDKLIKKKCETSAIKRVVEGYSIQLQAISREISRRALEIKSLQKGIGTGDEF
jgi:hypothetical protein